MHCKDCGVMLGLIHKPGCIKTPPDHYEASALILEQAAARIRKGEGVEKVMQELELVVRALARRI